MPVEDVLVVVLAKGIAEVAATDVLPEDDCSVNVVEMEVEDGETKDPVDCGDSVLDVDSDDDDWVLDASVKIEGANEDFALAEGMGMTVLDVMTALDVMNSVLVELAGCNEDFVDRITVVSCWDCVAWLVEAGAGAGASTLGHKAFTPVP